MMTLPTELLHIILECLDYYGPWPDSVSFGLINRRMYPILKRIYPKPIFNRCGPSYSQVLADGTSDVWRWKMQYIIGSFLGPDYRQRFYYPGCYENEGSDIPFLKRSIYGDGWSQKEEDYNHRWHDWKQNRYRLDFSHPYLTGEDWYAQAIYSYRSKGFGDQDMACTGLLSYPKTIELHGTTWDAFSEWKDLVRFDGDTPSYRYNHKSDDKYYGGERDAGNVGNEDHQYV
jgi:hypothetical protein